MNKELVTYIMVDSKLIGGSMAPASHDEHWYIREDTGEMIECGYSDLKDKVFGALNYTNKTKNKFGDPFYLQDMFRNIERVGCVRMVARDHEGEFDINADIKGIIDNARNIVDEINKGTYDDLPVGALEMNVVWLKFVTALIVNSNDDEWKDLRNIIDVYDEYHCTPNTIPEPK